MMNERTEKAKRPTSISVICVIGFIGAVFTVPMVISPMAQQIGSWYPPFLGLSAVIGAFCMVGMWMMKKWAAYTYIGFVALNQVVLLAMGVWNIMTLLAPAIVIFFALKHVSKMT